MSTETPETPAETSDQIICEILTDAARRGIHAGQAGGATDATGLGIASNIMASERLASRVTVHPHRIAKHQAEAAVAVVAAQQAESRRIREILGFDRPGAKGTVTGEIDLGMGTWVVEVEGGPFDARYTYTAIIGGQSCRTWFAHKDEALLYAIGARHGGGPDSQGYLYAAKILDVPTAHDA